jgi:hypothetical protein
MSSARGQDAKFFTRGKIQVGQPAAYRCWMMINLRSRALAGVPRGAAGGGREGQEGHQAPDSAEEDCGEHHHGQR